jgi:hypothetical protein
MEIAYGFLAVWHHGDLETTAWNICLERCAERGITIARTTQLQSVAGL